jgi:flagellar capping protein FliD
MPKGFLPRTHVGDLFLGDLYTSLSQIGVKTNATGEGGDMYGLLELNTDSKLPILEDILKKTPDAVADFFVAFNKGTSDSINFSYASSMQNITRPGAYDVKYDIDGTGKVTNSTINGKEAKYYRGYRPARSHTHSADFRSGRLCYRHHRRAGGL